MKSALNFDSWGQNTTGMRPKNFQLSGRRMSPQKFRDTEEQLCVSVPQWFKSESYSDHNPESSLMLPGMCGRVSACSVFGIVKLATGRPDRIFARLPLDPPLIWRHYS